MEKREKLSNFSDDKSRVKESRRSKPSRYSQEEQGTCGQVCEVTDYWETWAGQKSERGLGSLRRVPAQDKELKARQTEGDEDRQKHLCSHPSLFAHWNVTPVLGLTAPLSGNRGNAKCSRQRCLGCTQGCTASEFGLTVHKAWYQWGFHTENSPCSLRFLVNTEPRAGRQNWWQQSADVSYFNSSGDSNLSIRSEKFRPGKPFQSQPCFKSI